MARNKNEPQDQSLEALLFAQIEDNKKANVEEQKARSKQGDNHKEVVKNLKAIYTPLSKLQTNFVEFNKNHVAASRAIQSELAKNSELLKQNISNTKSLMEMLSKTLDPNKKPAQATTANKKDKQGPNNFDNKARHEQQILGNHDGVVPLLSSIKEDTSEIVKLLKQGIKKKEDQPQPRPSNGPDLPITSPKIWPYVAAAAAAALAMRHKEVGNATHAGLGIARAAATVASPIVQAARAGASTVTGAAKVGAAAEAAKNALTLANMKAAMQGPQKVGTVGKIGAGLGVGATLARYHEGDYAGAAAQGLSTILPLILAKSKFGKMATLASAGIDLGLLGRDYVKFQDKKEEAALRGETIKSPLDHVKDDIKKVGSFLGISSGPDEAQKAAELDPVVKNTSETNKILEEIRDGKTGTASSSGSSLFAGSSSMVGTAVVGGLLAHRFGLFGKLANGVASTGLGARVGAGLGSAAGAIGSQAGRLGAIGLSAAGTVGKKALGKLIPGVGLYMGATGAYDKIKEGDWTGAALEGGSGIASLFPGIGTAVAIGLQGISATRDALKEANTATTDSIKATNGELQKNITSTNAAQTDSILKGNESVSASILSNSQLANKNIADTSKTANDSLTKSATTLTSTSTGLASTLTSASNTLLGMIAKFTVPGMIASGGKAVYDYFANGSAKANENAQSYGSAMNKNRAGNQMMVYKAFLNAGMSPQQAKIFTAEIGRENAYSPEEMFGSHVDPKNGLTNVGMMSWQKDRADKFMKFMKANGQIDENGRIRRSQESLDAQARFIKEELSGSYYNKAGDKFLNNKNISYADGARILGKDYIGWRYDDKAYASGHDRRDRYYATLNEQLRNGTPIQPKTPVDPKKKNVKYISQKEMDKLSKAAPRPATPLGPQAIQAWEKAEKARVAELQKTQKGILSGAIVVGTPPKETNTVSKTAQPIKKDAENKNFDKPDNKEYYALGQKNVVVQNGVDMAGLQPNVRTQFYTMVGELFATKGAKGKVVVTSAYRSPASQQALWNKKLKENGGDEAKTRKYVAKPGTSNHEKGLALDLDTKGSNNVNLLQSSGLLQKYGFSRPLSHEPWHIEYGSGKAGATALASTAGLEGGDDGPIDVAALFSTGMAAVLNSDAMNSVREFMKGSIDKPKDKYGPPVAEGHFTKDESDPTRVKPKDSGNGDMWENLDQQLGNGEISRQERNADYEKVKAIFTGGDVTKRQERNADYEKVKRAFGGSNSIFRQIGGKYGWLADIFGGMFGEDDLLGSLFGILTGSQDISGLPRVLAKSITGNNPAMESQGAFGGGFGGGLAENQSDTQASAPVSATTDSYDHLDGSSTVYNEDGSYVYTRKDGRQVHINADGTVSKIEKVEPPLSRIEDGSGQTYSSSDLYSDQAQGVFTEDSSDGLPGMIGRGYAGLGGMIPNIGGVSDLGGMAVGGGFGGGLSYDNSFTQYENAQFEQAKQIQMEEQKQSMQVNVSVPESQTTSTAQAPSGGKSSQAGLGGTMFTRNPDSIIREVAVGMLRNSVS